MATAKTGRVCNLREELDFRVVNGSTVDRENALIRKVKVLSKYSPNKHGMSGAMGTTYELPFQEAIRDAIARGDSAANVNIGHPSKINPDEERDPEDGNGVLLNPVIQNDETYADWQLIPSHPMTASILDCAEKENLHGQYALSINARGYGELRDGRYCLTELQPPGLRNVDLVRKGGANKNLFESAEPMKLCKFADVAPKAKNAPKNAIKRIANLIEMYEDMATAEVPMDDAAAPEEGDWKMHCGNLLKAIVMDDKMTPEEMRAKVMAALKCLESKAEEGNETDAEESDADTDAMESREREELRTYRAIEGVRELCESLEFTPDTAQVKKWAKLKVPEQVKAIVGEKKTKQQRTGGAYTGSGRDIYESRQTQTIDFSDRSADARKKRAANLKSA